MTQKEKAAAYDRALEVMHKYDGVNIMFTIDLKEEMFPELKKGNEDERIRKDIKQHFLHLDDSFPDKAKWLAWLEKQKSSETNNNLDWSNEDEDYYNEIMTKLEITKDDALLSPSEMSFLKSLKDRVQPKKEWSVEDESNINHILNFLNYPKLITSAHTKEILEECIAWLSSLKFKGNWKPSDKQIEGMDTLMVNLNKNPLLLDNYTQANLRLLYDDLKKL